MAIFGDISGISSDIGLDIQTERYPDPLFKPLVPASNYIYGTNLESGIVCAGHIPDRVSG